MKNTIDGLDVAAKIVIAVVVGLWVFHTYPDSKEKEFRKDYWNRQMSLFFDATQATAKIATLAEDDPERQSAVKTFWQLYWGQMTIVESKCEKCDPVDQKMIAFGNCLRMPGEDKPREVCNTRELQQRSISLGKAVRDSIGRSWDEKLEWLRTGCPTDGSCPVPK